MTMGNLRKEGKERETSDLYHNDANQDTTNMHPYSALNHLNELLDVQAFLLFGFRQ